MPFDKKAGQRFSCRQGDQMPTLAIPGEFSHANHEILQIIETVAGDQ